MTWPYSGGHNCKSLPAATKLGQGNIFTSVCQEFCPHGGRVSASVHAGTHHPPRADTPREQTPPPPLTRQTPPGSRHTPPDQADPPGSRHTPPDQANTPPLDQADHCPPRPGRTLPSRNRQTPPPGSRLQHTVYERPVRILLECILVRNTFSTSCLSRK